MSAIPAFCISASLSQLGILRNYGIRLRKSLGQHILIHDNIAETITPELDLRSGEGVIEIGPGLGALTRRLAALAMSCIAGGGAVALLVLLGRGWSVNLADIGMGLVCLAVCCATVVVLPVSPTESLTENDPAEL